MTATPPLSVDPTLAAKLQLGLVALDGLTVRERDPELSARLDEAAAEWRARVGAGAIGALPGVQLTRALYHAFGMDPTKRRPSSEALLRRALKGQPLPQVNTLVDVNNLISLRYLLPIGLYDLDRVAGPIVARLGRAGEPYEAIGREQFSVDGRLVLADDRGPFGSPTSDSTRTMITPATRRALAVLFTPPAWPRADLQRALEEFAAEARRYNGGTVTLLEVRA